MIRPLITYPDPFINRVSGDVRQFDDSLHRLIEDMKETMEAHQAEGLAAIQVGSPLSVVVIKQEDGGYLELINPRILNKKGSVDSVERTLYMPQVERNIKRYESISLIYQDRDGQQHSLKLDGPLALLVQRKFDYVFGGSYVNKMNPKERKNLEKELASDGVVGSFEGFTPISKREYFKSMMNKLLVIETVMLFTPLMGLETETLAACYRWSIYITIALLLLNAAYYAYAMYEAKRVVSCTGCQVVSFLSISLRYLTMTGIVFAGSYFILGGY